MLLGLIFLQDMKARAVSWVLFPCLGIAFLACRLATASIQAVVQSTAASLLFVSVQFLLLSAWFSFRQRKWVNITRSLLGWGDILVLISVCFYLSAINFLLFYVFSLVVAMLYGIIFWRNKQRIPLAGLQSLLLALLLCVDWFQFHFELTDDAWFINLLLL